jgi:hypothetical protein
MVKDNGGMNGIPWGDDISDMILECLLNKYSDNEEAKRFILNLSPDNRLGLMILESQFRQFPSETEADGQNPRI